MSKLIAINESNPLRKSLHICWFLHNHCNFHCSYCWDVNHNGKNNAPPFEKITEFLDKVFAHYEDKNLIHFSFTGGEPTLWPDFHRLCKYLSQHHCYIGMTTNGSKPAPFWEKVSPFFNWICLSYHPEKADQAVTIEAINAIQKHTQVTIRIMMHPNPDLWDKSLAFSNKLTSNHDLNWIRIEYVPIQEILGSNEGKFLTYTPEQKKILKDNPTFERFDTTNKPSYADNDMNLWSLTEAYDNGRTQILNSNELIIRDLHHFKGWKCNGGIDLLFIDHLQDIWRATCHADGCIGNVNDSKISFPTHPVVCTKDNCVCETDIQIPKYSPDEYL